MAANIEIEVMLRKAMRLLHSTHTNSATELRLIIDEVITHRYGVEKTLSNTISQRYLDEEPNFPGRIATPPPDSTEIINLTNSPPRTISPDTIMEVDEARCATATLLSGGEDDGNLKEFGDLNCCVCGEMMFTATNRLIECSKCGALYHQECHKPRISDEEASEDQEQWQCDNCCNKPSTSGCSKDTSIIVIPDEPISLVSKTNSSRSSSSSNSSSPFSYYKQEQGGSGGTAATGKHSSSSSRSHKEERRSSSSSTKASIASSSASASSGSNITMPTIGVISAAEKATERHASSSSSSSKKSSHSSSKSSKSSKHHESSKRKSSK